MQKIINLIIISLALYGCQTHKTNDGQIDLTGKWDFQIDSLNVGVAEKWFEKDLTNQIYLPGSMDEAGFGKEHIAGTPLYDGKPEIQRPSRKRHYIGAAWYQKQIDIPQNWDNKKISVSFERCMWQTELWVNGKYAGENHTLCAPHEFDITSFVKAGENTLSMRIDNSPFVNLGSWSHGYSPSIQTIWNGAVGDIHLIAKDNIHMENIRVYPSLENQTLIVKGQILSSAAIETSGELSYIISDKDNKQLLTKTEAVSINNKTIDFETTIELNNKLMPWDEFTPNLYSLQAILESGKTKDLEKVRFGLRDIEAKDGRFLVNGKKSLCAESTTPAVFH